MKVARNWTRYALALDWHLAGVRYVEIGRRLGVTRERARQLVFEAKAQLAFRLYPGIERPLIGHYSAERRLPRYTLRLIVLPSGMTLDDVANRA